MSGVQMVGPLIEAKKQIAALEARVKELEAECVDNRRLIKDLESLQYTKNVQALRARAEAAEKEAEQLNRAWSKETNHRVRVEGERDALKAKLAERERDWEFARDVARRSGPSAAWVAFCDMKARRAAKEPSSCGYCEYDEAEGGLIEQCPTCKAKDRPAKRAAKEGGT